MREARGDRYLIQLERPAKPVERLPAVTAHLDQINARYAEAGEPPLDPYQPFEVPGKELEYLGLWGDEDLDDDLGEKA